jgi:hypothetical protein
MFDIICTILITVHTGGSFYYERKADVEGKILFENELRYVVDFSKDVKRFHVDGKPTDYQKVLVDKDMCVKEQKPLTF